MQLSFEQEKNIKAAVYTGLICFGLSLIFFVFKFQEPTPTVVPPLPEYMEVNLGNSNTGAGAIPPKSKAPQEDPLNLQLVILQKLIHFPTIQTTKRFVLAK